MLLSVLLLLASCDRVRPLVKRAECERKAGHTLKALELVEEHLAKKPRDKKAVKLREALRAEVVSVECFSEPDGALLEVDGADPAGRTPITVTLDAGAHAFRFTHDGYQPLERQETAVAGTRPKVTAVLERLPQPEDAPEAAPPPAPVEEPAPRPELTAPPPAEAPKPPAYSSAPLVIGTAGIFVAIGGGVLILTSALSPVFDTPARNRQWVGYGLVGAGVAAGLAAVIWLLVERRPGAPTQVERDTDR